MCSSKPLREPNTQSNLNDVSTKHLHLALKVDFDQKLLSGSVILDMVTLMDNVREIVLDTSYLAIKGTSVDGKALKYSVADRHPAFGSALTIELPEPIAKAGGELKLTVDYSTTEKCTAIQFLEPSQTVGKKYPYLFSQCEAIHARALVPCQDSPSIKLTYSASIQSPLPVLMSALQTGAEAGEFGLTTYNFVQKTKMPSYLIAIAAGNLQGREIGPRSTVWSEPEVVDAAAFEFDGTETFIKTGEELLTPYEWGRYDLLVLPPSFPYGGMENPCLTFVTPTLLAGDKSAVDVVAHEIAHSWMGNLVTTKTWEHFWLNEGWTVFVERKITGRIHGESERQFSAIIGWKALKESVELFGNDSPATHLNTNLDGIDPDDYFSTVPYEKGFNLLYHIEKVVGGAEVFEPYMRAHVQNFAGTSITTDDWKAFLYQYMEQNHGQEKIDALNTIDWETWLRAPGMPPVDPQFDTTLADACYTLAKKWDESRNGPYDGFQSSDFETLTPGQKVVFLERMTDYESFPHAALSKMDQLYNLTSIRNAEIRFRWQQLCLQASYEPVYPAVVEFLVEQGRMKFVRPLYRLLSRAQNGEKLAKDTYLKHKNFYHPIAGMLIEKDIGLRKSKDTQAFNAYKVSQLQTFCIESGEKSQIHHLDASRSFRILWLLEELEVPYEIKEYKRIDSRAPPELKKVHPLGKAPVIEVDGQVIIESGAIVEYLIQKYGKGRLAPASTFASPDYVKYLQLLHFAEGSLMPTLVMKLVFGIIPTKAPFFIRPLLNAVFAQVNKQFVEPEVKANAGWLESLLQDQQWFVGNELSGADIMLSFPLQALTTRAPEVVGPNIKAWVERVHARPAYQRAEERGGKLEIL
ncbi:hypothetical protein BZG36_03179 [Bifiguratus adelaidae]|uniref:Leukotriene A(4) hydrolase n=1 Tax=Bifiguratus adelaidae TaxID=1938954 RepID=A0A261XYJ3_9FUNG|nr:hypothetical protein BZG36_03179 [Bifiguratus adelaidae]